MDMVNTQDSPRSDGYSRKKNHNTKGAWFRAGVMVIATVFLCLFLSVFILQSALDLFGLNQPDNQIEVKIPDKSSLSEIASLLNKAGVIEKSFTFQLYGTLKKDKEYFGGDYIFNANMGYDEILRDLRSGNKIKQTVKATFAEGVNIYEIALELEKNEVCKATALLDYLETAELPYEFIDQMPTSDLRFRRFEGYFFPDTYEFYVDENVASVARKFFNNFDNKITTQMKNKMRDMNMTLDETITLASIIQKEAGGVHGIDEMKRISSVFHNRLNLPDVYPKLQSDVTREYVDRFIKPFQDFSNQPMYDSYNTYAAIGLPTAPICNPGIDAITAALSPEQSGNYFFVTDDEENFHYAANINQHNENIRKADSNNLHGTDTGDK